MRYQRAATGWSPNLIRNIASLPDAALHTVCDVNPKALETNAKRYPGVKTTPDYAEVRAIVAAVEPFDYDRIYESFGLAVRSDAKERVRASAERYIRAMQD